MAKPIYSKSNAVYLQPSDVWSKVCWAVNVDKNYDCVFIESQIELSDCSRHIRWDVSRPKDLRKIDKAIAQLTAVRKAAIKAFKVAEKERAKIKKQKAAKKRIRVKSKRTSR